MRTFNAISILSYSEYETAFPNTQKCAPLLGLLLLFMAGFTANAQTPTWQTAVATAAPLAPPPVGPTCVVKATATNASGDVYVVGNFSGTASFGSTTFTSTFGTSVDIFIAKWNTAASRYDWAVPGGGTGTENARLMAVNGADIYVVGDFNSQTATFGSISIGAFNYPPCTFVTKLTDAGTSASFIWVKRAGASDGTTYPIAMAMSGTSMFLTGSFSGGVASFDNISVTGPSNAFGVRGKVFVAKLNDAGTTANFAWAMSAGGGGEESGSAIVVAGNNVYVGGYFTSTILNFGSITLPNTNPLPVGTMYPGSSDAFVAKYIDAGSSASLAWAQKAGSLDEDYAYGLAVNGANVYLTGAFSGTAYFGSNTLVSAGGKDVFVTRLTDAGSNASFAWAQQAGGAGDDAAYNVSVSNGNTVLVRGYVIPPAAFSALAVATPVATATPFLASLGDAIGLANANATELSSLTLFPSPAHGRATVRLPAVPGVATATLTLVDALGRTIRTQAAATNAPTELDLTNLAAGIYAVRVAAGSHTATRRLVVE